MLAVGGEGALESLGHALGHRLTTLLPVEFLGSALANLDHVWGGDDRTVAIRAISGPHRDGTG